MDLEALLPLDPRESALERLIVTCLFDGGVWDSPRTSDGVERIEQVAACGPGRVSIGGWIFEIDQTRHPFWLEVVRSDVGTTWSLRFDFATSAPRYAPTSIAEDIAWRVRLAGEATMQDGALAAVPGSTRHE